LEREVFTFAKFYEDDFPTPKALDAELDLWEKYWVSNKESCPDNVEMTMSKVLL